MHSYLPIFCSTKIWNETPVVFEIKSVWISVVEKKKTEISENRKETRSLSFSLESQNFFLNTLKNSNFKLSFSEDIPLGLMRLAGWRFFEEDAFEVCRINRTAMLQFTMKRFYKSKSFFLNQKLQIKMYNIICLEFVKFPESHSHFTKLSQRSNKA